MCACSATTCRAGSTGLRLAPIRWLFILVAVLFALPAAAQASSYCVDTTGCDFAEPTLQAALTDAKNHPGEDTVRIGNAVESVSGGFTYDSPDAVHIEGKGGRNYGPRPPGGSTLADSTANPTGETVLTVKGTSASTISGVDVSIPGGTGSGNFGIVTNGAVDNVIVHPVTDQPPSGSPTGVQLLTGASLTNSDVRLGIPSGSGSSDAAVISGASTSIRGVTLEARVGVVADPNAGSGTVREARIEFASDAFVVRGGSIAVDDVLMLHRAETQSTSVGVLVQQLGGGSSALNVNRSTLVGSPNAGSAAFSSVNLGSGSADLSFRNGIVTGYPVKYQRQATSSGAANITTDYSDYGGIASFDTGPGAFTETNHIDVAPGFVSATDFHLRPDSPLIDAADPAESGGLDGDGDCVARRDIGAFEFTPGPRAPRAVVSLPFDASASCDPDGDALTFAWAFDDGTSAAGAVVQHTFAKPGTHFGTVTVTDSTGRSATAAASLVVPPPPFPGVGVAPQRVRVSKQRLGRVAVGCPPAAVGSCAGRLTLAGKTRSFFYAPGSKHKLSIKLSKKTFQKLRKKKELDATATAVAHDGNGSTHRTTAKITLLRPR